MSQSIARTEKTSTWPPHVRTKTSQQLQLCGKKHHILDTAEKIFHQIELLIFYVHFFYSSKSLNAAFNCPFAPRRHHST